MRRLWLLGLAGLAGCDAFSFPRSVDIPPVCQEQVYADPTVKRLIAQGAGSEYLRINTENQLRAAKEDATHRCMQQKGLAPPGGGVERQRITD